MGTALDARARNRFNNFITKIKVIAGNSRVGICTRVVIGAEILSSRLERRYLSRCSTHKKKSTAATKSVIELNFLSNYVLLL